MRHQRVMKKFGRSTAHRKAMMKNMVANLILAESIQTTLPTAKQARKDAEPWATQPEDALTWVMFPQVAKDFLPKKYAKANKRDVGLQEQEHEAAYPV